jgi:hypothetical protein
MKISVPDSLKHTHEYVTVTHDQIVEWLTHVDPNQRSVSESNLQKIRASIARKGFQPVTSRIVWSDEGTIIDGMHTLVVLSELGGDWTLQVMRNVPRDMLTILGDGCKPWSPYELQGAIRKEPVTRDRMSISNFLHYAFDGRKPPRRWEFDAQSKMLDRWVHVHDELCRVRLPQKIDKTGSMRGQLVRGMFGIVSLFAHVKIQELIEELRGNQARSREAKRIVAVILNWHSDNFGTVVTQDDCRKVLRALTSYVGYKCPDDPFAFWRAKYEEFLFAEKMRLSEAEKETRS